MALTDYRQDMDRPTPSCTCPAFRFSGYRTCKHLAALLSASWIPACSGNSCTAACNSSRCLSSSAGGNPRTARISGPQALPRRRPTPTGLWCVGPAPAPPPSPLPSSPGPAARRRTTAPAPGAWAPGSSADARPWHPSPIVPNPDVSLSHPSPTPL